MPLTQRQERLLREIRSKLDTADPRFAGAEVIRAAFTPGIPCQEEGTPSTFPMTAEELKKTHVYKSCGLYLHSWVLPLIDELLGETRS